MAKYSIILRGYNLEIPDLGVSVSLRQPNGKKYVKICKNIVNISTEYICYDDLNKDYQYLIKHVNLALQAVKDCKNYYEV